MTVQPPEEHQNRVMLSGGVIHLQWRAPMVTEQNVMAAMARVSRISAGAAYPLLIELRGVRTVNNRAHQAVAAGRLRVTQLAIVAGSPVDWATAHFYLSKMPPGCTMKLFTSVTEALSWLDTHRAPSGGNRLKPSFDSD
ncbi:hypothetical protein AAIH32_16005 [Pseudarthrobacter oxydans]|uniref:DUF7793 family protein n=1 Tax=Pseudarthrobacter oxydans TaxID=1671 RepID=UPI003D2C8DED